MKNISVVILAAGSGSRFKADVPKCLCPIGSETVISRQIRQINTYISGARINVVTGWNGEWVKKYCESLDPNIRTYFNSKYKEDKNIYSCLVGLSDVSGDALILEGDCVFSDEAFEKIGASLESTKDGSTLFLGAQARSGETNGTVEASESGSFVRYAIGKKESVENSYNMTGATRISSKLINVFKADLKSSSSLSLEQYYFDPMVRFNQKYNIGVDILGAGCYTFNTKEAYTLLCSQLDCKLNIQLFEVSRLKHIEDYSRDAVASLTEKIRLEGIWNRPICIDPQGLVMDGQHRMEVAINLGLKKVPAAIFEYKNVPIYSLRENYDFTCKDVIKRSISGNIYPYKTVKHIFDEDSLICNYMLEELK